MIPRHLRKFIAPTLAPMMAVLLLCAAPLQAQENPPTPKIVPTPPVEVIYDGMEVRSMARLGDRLITAPGFGEIRIENGQAVAIALSPTLPPGVELTHLAGDGETVTGITATGDLYTTTDAQTWTPAGSLEGEPSLFRRADHADEWLAVTHDDGVNRVFTRSGESAWMENAFDWPVNLPDSSIGAPPYNPARYQDAAWLNGVWHLVFNPGFASQPDRYFRLESRTVSESALPDELDAIGGITAWRGQLVLADTSGFFWRSSDGVTFTNAGQMTPRSYAWYHTVTQLTTFDDAIYVTTRYLTHVGNLESGWDTLGELPVNDPPREPRIHQGGPRVWTQLGEHAVGVGIALDTPLPYGPYGRPNGNRSWWEPPRMWLMAAPIGSNVLSTNRRNGVPASREPLQIDRLDNGRILLTTSDQLLVCAWHEERQRWETRALDPMNDEPLPHGWDWSVPFAHMIVGRTWRWANVASGESKRFELSVLDLASGRVTPILDKTDFSGTGESFRDGERLTLRGSLPSWHPYSNAGAGKAFAWTSDGEAWEVEGFRQGLAQFPEALDIVVRRGDQLHVFYDGKGRLSPAWDVYPSPVQRNALPTSWNAFTAAVAHDGRFYLYADADEPTSSGIYQSSDAATWDLAVATSAKVATSTAYGDQSLIFNAHDEDIALVTDGGESWFSFIGALAHAVPYRERLVGYDSANRLVAIPFPRLLWHDGVDYLTWQWSPWYGFFATPEDTDWVWHPVYGWQWIDPVQLETGFWVYDTDMGWLLLARHNFPAAWRAETAAWITLPAPFGER